MLRDLARQVQDERKKQGLKPDNKISIKITDSGRLISLVEKNKETLLKEFRATEILTEINEEKREIRINLV
jgi:hypothetical protein